MPWRRRKTQDDTPLPSVKMGNVSGSAVVIGQGNTATVGSNVTAPPPDWTLKESIDALRKAVEAQAAPGVQRSQAIEQVDALGRAAAADPPNGRALIAARDWFEGNLPSVVAAVGTVLARPSLDTAINAAIELMRSTAAGQSHSAEGGDSAG